MVRFLSVALVVMFPLVIQAQQISVSEIIESYNNINFQRTLSLSGEAIQQFDQYSRSELIDVYKFRAFAAFNLGEMETARASFLSALTLKPDLQLDAVTVSPKIISYFDKIRTEFERIGTGNETVSPGGEFTRYVLVREKGPDAAWRSLVVPGWGQLYKQEQLKGYIVMGAFVANSIALTAAVFREEESRDAYLNSTLPAKIESRYNTYNRWHRTRIILTYSQILIWGYAFADALWSPLPAKEPQNLSFFLKPGHIGFSLRF